MKKGVGIVVQGVSKVYRIPGVKAPRPALRDVNLRVAPGEFLALLGPSGCGKTTLLNIVSGLDREYEGTVRFGVPSVPEAGAGANTLVIGYVFQEARLLPWLTVRENLKLVLTSRPKKVEHDARIDGWLARVGLQGYGEFYPGQLSAGMQQRVAVARALMLEPDVLVMDEPFGALDELTALKMRDELLSLWSETGCTVLFVTHNPLEAVYLADRVAIMSPSPGRIVGELEVTAHMGRPRESDNPSVWRLAREAVAMLRSAEPG